MNLAKLGKLQIIGLSALYIIAATKVNVAKEMWEISKPYVLHTLPTDTYTDIHFGKIVTDGDRIIVLFRYVIKRESEYQHKTSLFVLHNDKWEHNIIKGFYNRLAYNNHNYIVLQELNKQKEERQLIFHIHRITDSATLSKIPERTINAYESEKRIPRAGGNIFLVSTSDPNTIYALGFYTEMRYDPISLISCFISGGHGGFAERPLMRVIKNNSIIEEYKLPVKLQDREVMRYLDHKVIGDKIHVIWRKYTEYGSGYESHVLQYAYFDCTSKTWSKTIEPFGEHTYSGKMMYDWLSASLAYDQGNLYCVWYWTIGQKKQPLSEHIKERAIYFNQYSNNRWSQPTKIYSSNRDYVSLEPKIVIGKMDEVYVFWEQDYINKGLFCRQKTGNQWSEVFAVIDEDIGLLDLVVGQNKEIHLIYTIYSPKSASNKSSIDLIYTKLSCLD